MILLILLLYGLPVYLIFFRYKLIPLTSFLKVFLWVPPVIALVFLWYALGRYTPMAQDAYVQAPVVQIAPQVGGIVSEVLIKDNAVVKKGDPLFRLDPTPYLFRVDQARAKLIEVKEQTLGLITNVYAAEESLRRAEANLEVARKGVDLAKADIESAQATLSKVKAQVEFDDAKVARNTKLMGTNAISREDYEESLRTQAVHRAEFIEAQQRVNKAKSSAEAAVTQVTANEASVREARAQRAKAIVLIDPVKALRRGVQNLESDIAALRMTLPSVNAEDNSVRMKDMESELTRFRTFQAEAERIAPELKGKMAPVFQAEETLKQATFDLEQTLVKAPMDGLVTNLQLTIGTYVSPGKPVITFIDTSSWRVVAPIPENWLARVKPGDSVTMTLRNYPFSFRTGNVEYVGRGVVSGQGVPGGTLPDPQQRAPRQTDTPETSQDFQVIVSIADDHEDQPLRIGATGRAVILADGGLGGVNQVASILMGIMAFMDYFFPKPPLMALLIGVVMVLSIMALLRYIRQPKIK